MPLFIPDDPKLVKLFAMMFVSGMAFSAVNMRAVFALCVVLGLLLWVFSFRYKSKSVFFLSQTAFIWLVSYLAWSAFTLLWSPAISGIRDWLVYCLKLLSIMVLAYFLDRFKIQSVFIKSLLAGFVFLCVVVLYVHFAGPGNPLDMASDGAFFNPLAQAAAVSILASYALHELLTKQHLAPKILFALLFVAATFITFMVSQQRLGYFSYFVGIFCVLMLSIQGRSRWIVVVSLLLLFWLNYAHNHTFSSRVNSAFEELLAYDFSSNFTSIGSRLHMWTTSMLAIQENWLWGYGFGSYGNVMPARFGDDYMCEIGCVQPHNQFLLVWLETGFIGLLLLMGFLAALAKKLIYDFMRYRHLHHGLVVVLPVFILSSLVDSSLFYIGYLHLFVALFALLLTPVQPQHGKST